VQTPQIVLHRRRRDEGALALLADHQPLADQIVDRLPKRDAAHREALAEDGFGLETFAGLQPAAANGMLEIVGKLPVQRLRT
jgi:hypothetical protein